MRRFSKRPSGRFFEAFVSELAGPLPGGPYDDTAPTEEQEASKYLPFSVANEETRESGKALGAPGVLIDKAYGGEQVKGVSPVTSQSLVVSATQSVRREVTEGPRAPVIPNTLLTPSAQAGLQWMLGLLAYTGKAGVFNFMVMKDAFDDGGATSARISQDLVSQVGKAIGSVSISGMIEGAIGFLAKVLGTLSEGDQRVAQAKAVEATIYEYCKIFGLPPMSVLHALAYYVPDRGYAMNDGGGSFLRYDEWGPGILTNFVKLYNALIKAGYKLTKEHVKIPDENFRRLVKAARIPVVNNGFMGRGTNIQPTRLANNFRYMFHIDSLIAEPWIPKRVAFDSGRYGWRQDTYDLYQSAVAAKPEGSSPWTFSIDDMERWMEFGGVNKGRWRATNQPSSLIFKVGHDPGLNRLPSGLSGILPGDYGTISVPEKDWLTKLDIDTTNGWFITV